MMDLYFRALLPVEKIHRPTYEVGMRTSIFILSYLAMLMASGCLHDSNASSSTNIGGGENVSYTIVSSGDQSGTHYNQQLRVIRSAEELSSLLSEVTLSGAIPNPEFSTNFLVSVFMGFGSGCGEELSVAGIEENGETLIIYVQSTVPGLGTPCPAVISTSGPYVFIELESTTKPISIIVDVETF